MVRAADFPPGTAKFVSGMPGEQPPWTRSVWLTSDSYFYLIRKEKASCAHRAFTTPTYVLEAPGQPMRKPFHVGCLFVFQCSFYFGWLLGC